MTQKIISNIDELAREYTDEKASVADLATKANVSSPTMRRALVEAGVSLRGKGRVAGKTYPKATKSAD